MGPVRKSKSEKVKFDDDGTVAVSVDLEQCLVPDPVNRQRLLNYFERTGHVLPPEHNLLQFYLDDTEKFTSENKMVINKNKTAYIYYHSR